MKYETCVCELSVCFPIVPPSECCLYRILRPFISDTRFSFDSQKGLKRRSEISLVLLFRLRYYATAVNLTSKPGWGDMEVKSVLHITAKQHTTKPSGISHEVLLKVDVC